MSEREKAARAIGFLEGLSAFLWSACDKPEGWSITGEMCCYYDEQVEVLRKAIFAKEEEE